MTLVNCPKVTIYFLPSLAIVNSELDFVSLLSTKDKPVFFEQGSSDLFSPSEPQGSPMPWHSLLF